MRVTRHDLRHASRIGAVQDGRDRCLGVHGKSTNEVLQDFRDEGAFRRAREAMLAVPIVESPLAEEVFSKAVDLYRSARRNGVTLRSSVDCRIPACAIRHDLEILHRDYAAIARISPLRHRAP